MNITIEYLFSRLSSQPYLADVAAVVKCAWERNGCPELPTGSTTTDSCHPVSEIDEACISDWCGWGGLESEATGLYNKSVEQLGNLIDVWGIHGYESTTTCPETGEGAHSPEWLKYRDEAREILESWSANTSVERFCEFAEITNGTVEL